MKYMGSKARISKHILPIIQSYLSGMNYYVEPFVGGANIIDKVDFNKKIGADINPYLISMWNGLKNDFIPPVEISRELYSMCREQYNKGSAPTPMLGYVGFNGSYGGRFYDGGYAGIVIDKNGKERNYPKEAFNNVMGQLEKIKDIEFIYSNYYDLEIPNKSLIYCDPPYQDVKEYSVKNFNSDLFFDWCRTQAKSGNIVLVSEYKCPNDFKCIWEMEVSSSLRANGIICGGKKSTEKLFLLGA